MAADPTQLSGIEFINEQEQLYFAEAMVGEEVQQFLFSTTGKILHGRAKEVRQQCIEELFKLDPYTPEGKKEHARIQRDAWCAEHFLIWCHKAIMQGRESAVLLDNYRG